jgi:hypothetical protein
VRVIINGEGLDLMGAFAGATMDDWRALIMDTGRGTAAVKAGIDRLDKLTEPGALTPDAELSLMDTLTDLVFRAKRRNGGRQHWGEVSETVPYLELMAEFGRAMEAAQAPAEVAEDPTSARTATDPGEDGLAAVGSIASRPAKTSSKKSKTG